MRGINKKGANFRSRLGDCPISRGLGSHHYRFSLITTAEKVSQLTALSPLHFHFRTKLKKNQLKNGTKKRAKPRKNYSAV